MKRQFISDLKPGLAVDGVFFILEAAERQARDGKPYLCLKLSDRTGTIDARAWDVTAALGATLGDGCFARIHGKVSSYRQRPQVVIDDARPEDAESQDQRQFIPGAYRDPVELSGYLDYFLTDVYDSDYASLLAAFFDESAFRERFSLAPGSRRAHHAYLGGLLEHTVSVTTLCQHAVVQHPRLDRDLLITASLLHDIGKIDEYVLVGRIEQSREGSLLGHVLIGQRLIEEKLSSLEGFPGEKELELLHAIISHHGELEWGAPKRPQSAEALVLHHLDNLDAKVKGYFENVEGSSQLPWREMQNLFRRPLSMPLAADREKSKW
jgi:3'-5' exoribonuclease